MSRRLRPYVEQAQEYVSGRGLRDALVTRRYRRYVAALEGNGTIRVTLAGQQRGGQQITSFRAYDGPEAIRIARAVGDWIYRHYDC